MGKEKRFQEQFTPWQRAALAHPHDCDREAKPPSACMHLLVGGKRSVILTCDIDEESAKTFGGPVWHVSVWPPNRARAETLLGGVGEGTLFEEPGVHPNIFHMRRRMTTEEMKLLGGEEA
jgi:hypothetical protein